MGKHGWKKRSEDADGTKKTQIEDGTINYLPSALPPICVPRSDRPTSRKQSVVSPAKPGTEGGRYRPLSQIDEQQIDFAIRTLLATVGLSEAPPIVIETVTARGGKVTEDGRLTFPEKLFDEALTGFVRNFTLHGQKSGHELNLSGKRVHMGTGGAAPQIIDLETGQYRDSTLRDLYDAARLVDTLENVHFFSRSLVARDMPDEFLLDINTAYASLAGTAKHVCTSATFSAHVQAIADICYTIAGSREAFEARPFCALPVMLVK